MFLIYIQKLLANFMQDGHHQKNIKYNVVIKVKREVYILNFVV